MVGVFLIFFTTARKVLGPVPVLAADYGLSRAGWEAAVGGCLQPTCVSQELVQSGWVRGAGQPGQGKAGQGRAQGRPGRRAGRRAQGHGSVSTKARLASRMLPGRNRQQSLTSA